jgi:hypothetical protein
MKTTENEKALGGVIGTLNRAYEETSVRDDNGYHFARGSLISNLANRHFNRESVAWALRHLEERGFIVIIRDPFLEQGDAISIKKWIEA